MLKDETQKKGPSNKTIALIVILVLVLSGTAVAVAIILRPPPVVLPAPAQPSGIQVITEENYVSIMNDLQEKTDRASFTTHMNTTWRFPDGKSASRNAVMGNSSANHFPFYFTVVLSDTGETVFTSGLLPLGTQIGRVVLEKELPQGTYDAVVRIHMVDEDGQPVESNAGFNISLIIEK